ncbi:MAG: hypothetical protein J0H83_12660 [Candidatus Melainabacteria bacterium]|jgi:hypothetical protein|nr:hypothetical protein [Candidatus Melainabacteria bacterium]
MMTNNFERIQKLITRLEVAAAKHENAHGGEPDHIECAAKYERAIGQLQQALQDEAMFENGTVTARGDELERAQQLELMVASLEASDRYGDAEVLKEKVVAAVAKQLNELDGFDR